MCYRTTCQASTEGAGLDVELRTSAALARTLRHANAQGHKQLRKISDVDLVFLRTDPILVSARRVSSLEVYDYPTGSSG